MAPDLVITNALIGEIFIVTARTNPAESGPKGLTAFIVEKGTPGFAVTKGDDKMGLLGSDWGVIGAELGRWSVLEPKLGLADYLLGKNYFNRGRWELGAKHLDEALARDLPLPRVKREAERTRLLVACALGEKGRAKQVLDQLKDEKGGSPRRWEATQRFAARCGIPVD